MIRTGELQYLITLQEYRRTPDGQGGFKSEWVTVAKVMAKFAKPKLATVQEDGTIISDMTREISIRRRTDIRKGWRVLYEGRIFDVEHTYDYDRTTTVLVCREVLK